MSIRYGHSWRTRHGRSWVSFPLWLWAVAALIAWPFLAVAAALWVLYWLIRGTVALVRAIAQAVREERAAKAAKR